MNERKKEAQVSEDSLFMHLIGFDIVKVYPSSLSVLAVSQAPLQLFEVSHYFLFAEFVFWVFCFNPFFFIEDEGH